MKHVTALISTLVLVALVAAGCASADASSKPANPAQLRASAKALKNVHSVGFHVKVTLDVSGNASGSSSPAAALVGNPVTLQIDGHAAKHGKTGVVDATFQLEDSMIPVTGEIRSTGGRVVYIKLPLLLGQGWKSYTVPAAALARHQDRLPAVKSTDGLNPLAVLTNVTQTDSGNTTTYAADVDPARLVAAIEKMATSKGASQHFAELNQLKGALKIAHGSISVNSTTHLPSAVSTEVSVTVPSSLQKQAQGVTGVDVKIDATFDSWNQPVTVSTPAGATKLQLNPKSLSLFSGLS